MDRMSSIEFALMNEKKEMEYYSAQAERSRNPVAKAMFRILARDEKEHMTRIKNLHEKLVADGSWPETAKIEVAGTDIRTVLDTQITEAAAGAEHDGDDVEALKRGIEFETKGEKFYAELAENCDNPMEKEFFGFLSSIEREHKLSMTDTLQYLEDPESWTERTERSGLDGA